MVLHGVRRTIEFYGRPLAAFASYVADFGHLTRVKSRMESTPFGQYLQVFRLGEKPRHTNFGPTPAEKSPPQRHPDTDFGPRRNLFPSFPQHGSHQISSNGRSCSLRAIPAHATIGHVKSEI